MLHFMRLQGVRHDRATELINIFVRVYSGVESLWNYCIKCMKGKWVSFPLSHDFPGGSDGKASVYSAGDQVRSLGWEDPLEKEMAIHSRTIAWKIPWTEEPVHVRYSPCGCRVGHD